jgi:hypothetical protein
MFESEPTRVIRSGVSTVPGATTITRIGAKSTASPIVMLSVEAPKTDKIPRPGVGLLAVDAELYVILDWFVNEGAKFPRQWEHHNG